MLRRVLLLTMVVSSACVSHPVGPARTFGKYEGKARTTAESALSEVQTARLVARTAARGSAYGPYTGLVLSDAEESLGGLASTFGSIQPPDERADKVRDDLGSIIGDAEDHVAAVRIAARRGALQTLADVAAPLDDDITALQSFLEAHGG
ncbi:MAG: hypothetical protein QOD30_1766 [Actinomycetota bacterium]|nr:hypothetical protein [Actinomycetota bacterium]